MVTENRTREAMPPLQVHHSVRVFFSVAIISEVGSGMNTLFSINRWLHGHSLEKLVPHLFGSVSGQAKKRKVHEALTYMRWVADIRALIVSVLTEYLDLWELLAKVVLQQEVEDSHILAIRTNREIFSLVSI